MARSLAVKVPTASLIALVEEKIASIKALVATYPADVKKYVSSNNNDYMRFYVRWIMMVNQYERISHIDMAS